MSSFQEKLLKIEIPKDKFNNFTSSKGKALHDLKSDKNVFIKVLLMVEQLSSGIEKIAYRKKRSNMQLAIPIKKSHIFYIYLFFNNKTSSQNINTKKGKRYPNHNSVNS